jgi:hypothetical protein
MDLGGGSKADSGEEKGNEGEKVNVNGVGNEAWGGYPAAQEEWGPPGFGWWPGMYSVEHEGSAEKEDKENKTTPEDPLPGWKVVINKKKEKRDKKGREWSVLTVKEEEFEWIKEDAIMDSGTVDTMVGENHVDKEDIRETTASKRGMAYLGAGQERIINKGEALVSAKSESGMAVSMTGQVGDKIKKILISVRKAEEAGNMVIFGADIGAIKKIAQEGRVDKNVIVNVRSGIKTRMVYKDGLYKYPMWIKRRKRAPMQFKTAKDHLADMDVGEVEDEKDKEENKCRECGDEYNAITEVF